MKYIFSAPSAVNLEITDNCNMQCGHCYNYWREDKSKSLSMTKEMMDRLIEIFVDAGIFHVVLTGGEPFVRFGILEYGIKKLIDNNISVSCNSNLTLATDDKIKKLRDAGLDHILTSLNSYDPETNDHMVNQKEAFKKILKGIDLAVQNGIKVSVNMIVSQKNKDHIYETGKLCYDLGCQKLFGTRVVPPVHVGDMEESTYRLMKKDAINTVEQMVRLKEDIGIMIGTLVSYPLCLLSDLERYRDFVGRGCPAQSGQVIGINANGETQACIHESASYGNVFKIGIHKAYRNMRNWHDKSYRYKECEGCHYIEACQSGCRSSAHSFYGSLDQKDQLMENKDNFSKHYQIVHDPDIYSKIEQGLKFYVPERLRFRKENGFYLINIRWANTITVDTQVGEFLVNKRSTGEEFDLNDFGNENKETLAKLYFKDAIESKYIQYDDQRKKAGLSIDI